MTHLPILVHDLVLILITAGVVVILFKWLKQPVVLGYIVAGFLVGPHMNLLPTVVDTTSIDTWSEIGIIFLLFALGLEFRYKKLLEVGTSALIATVVNMALMISIGYLVGYLLGWTAIECLFLGGMLSMASTTIIIKAFADMNKQNQRFANIVFAILIIEDIVAILMMVLFSTIASQTVEEMQLVESMLYLIFFIVIWFVVGIYIIPTIFKRIKKYLNDETLIIVSVGLCLGMVIIAHAVGFSAALGAFIMGSILAETSEAKRIEHLLRPLKNLFGAVFFVSVGMMIAPNLILTHIIPILILTAIVLVFRPIFVLVGVLASGESLKVAIQAGFSLAQIGEFSFIIATMGMQLGVIGEFVYPVIVAVSVITTFTTPYGIRYSESVYAKITKIIPAKWNRLITGRTAKNKKINISNDWGRLVKILFVPIFIYFMLAIAVILLSRMYMLPLITTQIQPEWGTIAFAVITIMLMSPFLYGIIRIRYSARFLYIRILKRSNHFSRFALLLLNLIRTVLCIALMLYVLIPLFPNIKGILIVVSIIVITLIAINPRYELQVKKLESQFLGNLNNDHDIDEHSHE